MGRHWMLALRRGIVVGRIHLASHEARSFRRRKFGIETNRYIRRVSIPPLNLQPIFRFHNTHHSGT